MAAAATVESYACPRCQRVQPWTTVFPRSTLPGYRGIRVLRFACPDCQEQIEYVIQPGIVSLGWSYGTTEMHFMGTSDVLLDGVQCHDDGDGVRIDWRGQSWRLKNALRAAAAEVDASLSKKW